MGSTPPVDAASPAQSSRSRRRLADAGAIVGVWAFVAFLSTAQRWTWLNTPDAEFYATLGLFGSEVTDRTVTPAYYWTRLGTIAPVRGLTELLGPWSGYLAFWLILLAVIVSTVFLTVRRFSTRFIATLMALLVALSTVILTFVGSPYVTGTAMAAMFVVLAGTVWTLPAPGSPEGARPRRRSRLAAPLLTGLGFGWLVMTNPNATFMTAAMWLAATAVITVHVPGRRVRYLLEMIALVTVGAATSFLLLLGASQVIFPGLDWFETSLFWSRALDLSGYVGDQWAFLRDISIVVPLTVMLTVIVALAIRPRDPLLHVAAVLSPTAFGLTLLIVLARPNGTLEVGHYQALQWPPALWALTLTVAAVAARRPATGWAVAAGAAGVIATIAAGHWTGTMTLSAGWAVALVSAALFLGAVASLTRASTSPASAARALVVLVCCTGLLMAGFQLLQNARRPTGVMAEGVYSNAFNPNDTEARLVSSYEAERWLIDQTSRDDTVMVWVDADWAQQEQTLLSMAAFQIWGINQVTPERTMEGAGVGNTRAARASVIAMYGKSMEAIVTFWSSIPREIGHSDPLCSDYPWPDPAVPTAYVCLTRLTWP